MILIRVGLGSCGISAGALEVYEELENIAERNPNITVKKCGCIGACYLEPIVELKVDDYETIIFEKVEKKDVASILNFAKLLQQQEKPQKLKKLFAKRRDGRDTDINAPFIDEIDYYKNQVKRVSERCGIVDPEDIEDSIEKGSYLALRKALSMKPEQIIEEVKKSGLRGRGGAGFSTGAKWEFLLKEKNKTHYLICNFDEGDPGAFMNRALVESDPQLVIEGIIIAAYALGVKNAFIYTRAEYPLAIKRLRIAIQQARQKGFLGKNILGKNFSLEIELRIGAGAFVCGEETALIKSIEGFSGRPVPRPPYPAEKGLWKMPTNINNVETLANIPLIIKNGAEWFRKFGTENSAGTKMFSLSGDIPRSGYIEVPFGMNIKQVSEIAGFGIDDFKAIQLGGPSGGFIGKDNFETPLNYDSVKKIDAIIGSGSMIVISKEKNLIDCIRYGLRFSVSESCGKCVPCREGTLRLYELATKISKGEGNPDDLYNIYVLSTTIKKTALCGLGQTAPNLVLSSIKHFFSEYEDKIDFWKGKKPNILFYKIDPQKCNGCHLCAESCPKSAISGRKLEIHSINDDLCVRCGLCFRQCPFKAIEEFIAESAEEIVRNDKKK